MEKKELGENRVPRRKKGLSLIWLFIIMNVCLHVYYGARYEYGKRATYVNMKIDRISDVGGRAKDFDVYLSYQGKNYKKSRVGRDHEEFQNLRYIQVLYLPDYLPMLGDFIAWDEEETSQDWKAVGIGGLVPLVVVGLITLARGRRK